MSENIVRVPTWAIPLIVSLFIGAASYGAAQANAETTQKELDRVESIVTLTEMQETAKSSDAKLQKLVELLIAQSQK